MTIINGVLHIDGCQTSSGENISWIEIFDKNNPNNNILVNLLEKYDGKKVRLTVDKYCELNQLLQIINKNTIKQ